MNLSRRGLLKLFGLSTFLGYDHLFCNKAYSNDPGYRFSLGPSLEIPLQEIYPAVFNGEIYVAGGFSPGRNPVFFGLSPSDRVFVYSPASRSWKNGRNLPESRHHLGMVGNSQYLYGIGGFSAERDDAWKIKDTVYRLGNGESDWLYGPPLPIPMAESVYASHGDNVHVIGGKTLDKSRNSNLETNSHFVLVQNEFWEKAAPAGIYRNSAASATLDGKVFVIGGRQSGEGAKNLRYSEAYDFKLDQWEPIRPLPMALAGLTAAPLNGKVIVAGGEAFGPNGNWKLGRAFNHVWSYDPAKDIWEKIADMPQARHGHGAVSVNDTMYIIGGASRVGPQDTLSSLLVFEYST